MVPVTMMAYFLEKLFIGTGNLICGNFLFQENEENFDICIQFAVSNIKYHRFLSVDSHKVTRSLQG